MPNTLKVTTSETSLQTTLQYDAPMDAAFSMLSLMLSATSNNVAFTTSSISLDWHLFKKNLISIAKVLKTEGVRLEPDAFSKKLIDQYLDDASSFHGESERIEISDQQLKRILKLSGFQRKLTKQQTRDALKLLSLKHGANFSVPGAGKTTTLLAVHTALRSFGHINFLFVVAPINAFISWEDELNVIFSGSKKILRLKVDDFLNFSLAEKKRPDIFLVNYEKMRRDIDRIYPFFIRNKIHLVLDESHRIKGGASNLSFQQIIKLADVAMRRDILSGTPMPQTVTDLAPQFDYLWSQNVVHEAMDRTNDEQVREVNRRIKRLFVRTTKKELGLIDPIIRFRQIQMGPIQSEVYELFRSEAVRILSNLDRNSKEYYRGVGKSAIGLLQAATNPMLLGTEDEYYPETLPVPTDSKAWQLLKDFAKYEKAAKIDYLRERVDAILATDSKNKIVIWSYFVRNVKLLERIFAAYSPVSIYGAIPSSSDLDEDSREQRIRRFHYDAECRLMIANPQAGGEGISLHRVCHHAIYLDRSFNAAHYLQSLDRIHRLGLDKSVETNIEILVAKDTIDEVVIKRLNLKTKLMGKVLDDPGLAELAYDPEDLSDQGLALNTEDIKSLEKHILVSND